MNAIYRGRFAPSPSGPLHFGSLVAAVASYADARSRSGEWLVRIDDLDPPRVVSGATADIVRMLEACGMQWDGAVVYQSARTDAYDAALHRLSSLNVVYPCACSRREVADSAASGIEGPVYPGTCRNGMAAGRAARAWRIDTRGAAVEFDDAVQGHVRRNLETEIGDFVLYRADGVFAFHLASAVDDGELGMTDVVRGADLLESSARQIYVLGLLRLPVPRYAHLPVAVNARGEKLSKQTFADPVDPREPGVVLVRALQFLGHSAPDRLSRADRLDVWQWAKANWRVERVPRVAALPCEKPLA